MTNLKTYFILLFFIILQSAVNTTSHSDNLKSKESPQIYRLNNYGENGVYTYSWNKTYVFEGKQINSLSIKNVYLELEIETPLDINNAILFSLKKGKALYYSEENDTYNAEYIDKRGYFMKKQYYRIEFQPDSDIKENDQYFITIYQNTQLPQELKYSIRIITVKQVDPLKKVQLPCPFNCLDRGECNKQEGHCQCNNGFVDYDCSKISTSLSGINNLSFENKQAFIQQDLEFDNTALRNGKFFHIFDRSLDGFLYLQIELSDELKNNQNSLFSKKALEIYYTLETKSLKGIGVADKQFANLSKKISIQDLTEKSDGIEIFIDEFHRQKSNQRQDLTDKDQQILLFGFRLFEENQDEISTQQTLNMNFKIVLKDQPTHLEIQQTSILAFIKSNQTISLLLIVLFFLIFVLLGLLIYIRKNNTIILQTQQQHLQTIINKKQKKSEEFKKIFDLIHFFTYNEENKKKYWPNLRDNTESDRQATNSNQPSCSICLCEFDKDEEVRVTYCAHYFHSDCLKEWLKKQKNCPNCRNDLTEQSLESKKKSPSTFLRSIFKNKLLSPNIDKKKQKEGYERQIDEGVLQLEPISSASQINQNQLSLKLAEQIKQQKENNKLKELKFKSSDNFYREQKPVEVRNKQKLLLTQNSIKHNSLTELDESEDRIQQKQDVGQKPKSRKLIKLDSMDSPSPIGMSKFSLKNESNIRQSNFKEIQ